MSFFAVAAVVSIGATAYGTYTQVQAGKEAEESAEAQADFEKASTTARLKEERSRTSQNMLRAQEEKRKALSKQRASFVKAGVLPSSPSADFLMGELGTNLQTRIQDMFLQQSDNMASIQSQGQARYFSAMQNVTAAKRQQTGALITGIGSIAKAGYKFQQNGGFKST